MNFFFKIAVLLGVFTGMAMSVRAQLAVPPPTPAYQPLSDEQLDQLLGPIALYPDPLLAEMLPASTFPTQIVLADRYVIGGGDPNQINQQPWDPSVQAVAQYPSVLKWMDDNLSATTELGQAFLNQQPAVMASVQRLRAEAYKLGNLQSTPQQQVTDDDGVIEIEPVNADELYVPDYQPDQVYDDSAGDSPYITFGNGYPIGDWLDDDFDWGNNLLIVWNSDYPRPANWWRESRAQRNAGHTTAWHSGNSSNANVANRNDRGWAGNAPSPEVTRQEMTRQVPQQGVSNYNEPISRPEANDALIGVQSSRDTRSYSDRGQQSLRTMPRSAPASYGGGGSHAGGGGGGGGGSGHR